MRFRLALLFVFAFPVIATASDYVLPIAGSVNNFRTDVRIFNPTAADSHLTLTFLPAGNQNNGSTFASSVHVTVPANQNVSYNDVISALFGGPGIAAPYIGSDTLLVLTTRVYPASAS